MSPGSTVLVAGIGNIFLGDDGFGPAVVRRLTSPGEASLPGRVRVVDYGIRGLHLAYDLLDGCDTLVLVDAVPADGAPGAVEVLEVDPAQVAAGGQTGGLDAHSMDPVAVLAGVAALGGALPPTYVVGARPLDLAEGMGLSAPLEAAVPVAADAVRRLVGRLTSGRSPADDPANQGVG